MTLLFNVLLVLIFFICLDMCAFVLVLTIGGIYMIYKHIRDWVKKKSRKG